jgi:hypothetical protein
VVVPGNCFRMTFHLGAPSITISGSRRTGVWQQIHDRLREQVRAATGGHPNPSAAILDSQSIRSSEAGDVCGYGAGKKIRGCKRHILVDILCLLLLVVVTAANRQDWNGAHFFWRLWQTVPALASDLGRWGLRRRRLPRSLLRYSQIIYKIFGLKLHRDAVQDYHLLQRASLTV